MKKTLVGVAALALLAAGCGTDRPSATAPEVIRVPLYANTANFMGTDLSGSEEVLAVAPGAPHPSQSPAAGEAVFTVGSDGLVTFKVAARNISNIIMSHIHCGRFGQNGPIRMWLYPVIGPTGAQAPNGAGPWARGVIASGRFDPAGVICPAANVGVDMPLLDAMRAGLTYVNIHTNDGIAPTNTGPGDFPGGEVRGQLDN